MSDFNNDIDNASFWSYQKVRDELENKFKVNYNLSASEIEQLQIRDKKGNLVKNHTGSAFPELPVTQSEAFKLFVDFYAAWQCELQKEIFETSGRIWNEMNIKAELDEIENWISKANSIKLSEALIGTVGVNRVVINRNSEPHEYLRLKSGFYERYLMTRDQHSLNSIAAIVYGKYFLFRSFLIEKLNGYTENASNSKPTVGAIALAHVYWSKYDETKKITKTNAKKIAEQYNLKGIRILKFYEAYSDQNKKLKPLNDNLEVTIKENKRNIPPFIERFKQASNMLQTLCSNAFDDINNDINNLKEQYSEFIN